jgi:RNA polymerase sigma-70 factor (ECF subfamily)
MNVRRTTESLDALEAGGYGIVSDCSMEKVVNRVYQTELIYKILDELKEVNSVWYEIILFVEVLERPQAEVAEELGISLSVLRARLHRAKGWIRNNYEEDYKLSK